MNVDRQRIIVEMEAVHGRGDRYASNALWLPGAHVECLLSESGTIVDPFVVEDGVVVVTVEETALPLRAVVSLPPNLKSKMYQNTTKLDREEKWKRRTFIWSIASALLAAGVAISVPFINTRNVDLVSGPVRSCQDSLKRLSTLSRINGQTVSNLAAAIDLHEETCAEVLDDVLEGVSR